MPEAFKLCIDSYDLFADDFIIRFKFLPCDFAATIAALNNEIQNIMQRLNTNKLAINPEKTRAIIFGSDRNITTLKLLGKFGNPS